MIRGIFKWLGLIFGVVLLAVVALFVFLVLDSGGDKDQLVKQAASPDGKLMAELHQITTPMHGGPDTLRVTIGPIKGPSGGVVYSRSYECTSDYSAFRLQWKTPNELIVTYGTCNSGRWHTKDENKVWQSYAEWHDVKINYLDSGYVAQAKP
jgi:hypothetical protein